MKKCKHAVRSIYGYIICRRDGSRRKTTPDNCYCAHCEYSWWYNFKRKLFKSKS